jgi:hypothetical protein
VVRAVPSEKHELIRGRARQRHDVLCCVSGRFEEVERAVFEPVDRTQPGDTQGRRVFVKVQLDEFAAFECLMERFGVRAYRFAGIGYGSSLEAGTDDEGGARRE